MTRASAAARPSASTRRAASVTPATSIASARKTDGAPPLSEREFQRQVTDLAEVLGWDWAHFRPAQTSRGWRTPVSGTIGEGWVDLVLVRGRDRRLIFAEIKAEKGVLTPRQRDVLDVLRSLAGVWAVAKGTSPVDILGDDDLFMARIEVHVFRPSDLRDPIADSVLGRILR